jgi:hypothetical protein
MTLERLKVAVTKSQGNRSGGVLFNRKGRIQSTVWIGERQDFEEKLGRK